MTEDKPVLPLSRLQKWVIAFGLLSMGVGFTISFVVAPPLARDAGLSEIQVAGILTISAFLYAFFTPVWGRIANRYGRKRIMVFALFATAITNSLFLLTLEAALRGAFLGIQTFFLLAGVRIAFGLLTSGLQPASFAAMTDSTTHHDRAAGLGFLGAAMSIGSILGPAAAAILARFGALAPLWGSVVFSTVTAIILLCVLPKDHAHDASVQRPKGLSLNDPRIRPFFWLLILYFTAVGMVQQTLAWFAKDRYLLERAEAVEAAGWIFAVMAIAMVLVQTFYVARFKPRPHFMLPIGLALVSIGYALAIMHLPFWFVCVAFSVVGAGSALIVPSLNALGTMAVGPQDQGSAAAVMSSAPPFGFVLGPLIGATLYMINNDLALAMSAAGIGVLFLIVIFRMREPPTPAPN
ncbi:MAG: MFS transporter [Ponticaulis sp.]|nr:MFS transporter [Ponticaulis sp.]|tara:strand:- start:26660 stop:27883 length:1224 start_codon:yes stop_codon:yes gene_type:complete